MNRLLRNTAFIGSILLFQILFIFYFSTTLIYTPYLYLLILFLIEKYMSRIQLLLVAFCLGLGIDFLVNSWGVHCFSAVLIAFILPAFSNLLSQQPLSERINFSQETMGIVNYAIAIFTLFFIYHLSVELLWNFSTTMLLTQLLKVCICTVLASITTIFLYGIFKTKAVVEDE